MIWPRKERKDSKKVFKKAKINAYIKLVRDDLLAPDIAAQRNNMNIDAFKKLL